MGIQGLSKVIYDKAPEAVTEHDIKNLFGRKVAIDASMAIYQFLIAVRSQDGSQLTNESGETTSHLMGIFYRTIRMLDNGIKPCYVFDGKPPSMKSDELAKRGIKRAEATKEMEKAMEQGDQENVEKFSRRMVKVTPEHNEDCQKLLTLMGVPYVKAPCEAEAQCAALAKAKKVYAVGSEDMDTITFAAPILMRHLTFSEAKKAPIQEWNHEKVLQGLGLTQDEFVDMCIMLGCDYCDSIKGVGPQKAYSLIKEHGSIEKILKVIDSKKHPVPDDWQFDQARKLFKDPEVVDPDTIELKWTQPDEEELVKYLCGEKGEERVRNGVKKMKKVKSGATQGRLDGFFKAVPKTEEEIKAMQKRKAAEQAAQKNAKKMKGKAKSGGGRPRKKVVHQLQRILARSESTTSTIDDNRDPFEIRYGDGTYGINGVLLNDTARFGNATVTQEFAQATQIINLPLPFDGIIGFGGQGLSNQGAVPPFYKLAEKYLNPLNSYFTVYLASQSTINPSTKNSSMGFGQIDSSLYTGELTPVPVSMSNITRRQGPDGDLIAWGLDLEGFTIGNTPLDGLYGQVVTFDTGLAFFALGPEDAKKVNDMLGATLVSNENFYKFDCDNIPANLPTVFIQFGGRNFPVTPDNYVLRNDDCRSAFDGSFGTMSKQWNVGVAFMRHYYMVYNLTDLTVSLATAAL